MKKQESSLVFASPIGKIQIEGNNEQITRVSFVDNGPMIRAGRYTPSIILLCARQLDEYFSGLRKTFQIPLKASGTDFQQQVWDQLIRIPYGETVAYKDIARAIGNPKAVRAVGGANNRNPIGIMVPCHRVIGKGGNLTGYGGGLWRKEWLLHHERKNRI